MIVVLNLNRYVGGGETLAIRLVEHLHKVGAQYVVIAAGGDCWISQEAIEKSFNLVVWPTREDSVAYMSKREKEALRLSVLKSFHHYKSLRVFTFCFRDLYNAYEIFRGMEGCAARLAHGVYHYEDVRYLASASPHPLRIVSVNRRIAEEYVKAKSMLFVNAIGCSFTLGRSDFESVADEYRDLFIPIPIVITSLVAEKKIPTGRKSRVICISRFVEFKIGAVLAVMRAAKRMPELELTVVGHGSMEFVLRIWMWWNRPSNVTVMTGVGPNEIDRVIDQHDVGYAQGTTILEMAKRGLPVIIAPYSRFWDVFRAEFRTPGAFGEVTGAAAFGELRASDGSGSFTVDQMLNEVLGNYEKYQRLASDYVKHFDSRLILPRIQAFIENAAFDPDVVKIKLAAPPIVKRLIRRVVAQAYR